MKNLNSCPYCSGKKACPDNSLASIRPDLLEEWNFEKNYSINPNDVTCGSNKRVWWKCIKNQKHEWKATIKKRNIGRGCPYCAGKLVNETNSLASLKSHIASQWHPYKNGNLIPDEVTSKSNKMVWWVCKKNSSHEWKAAISSRRSDNCPFCLNKRVNQDNCLSTLYPSLCKDWEYRSNNIHPDNVVPGSGKKVWWKCRENHRVFEPIRERVNRNSCSVCEKSRKRKKNQIL